MKKSRDFYNTLSAFKRATSNLDGVLWHSAKGYPSYMPSFDQFAMDIQTWFDAEIAERDKPLEGSPYDDCLVKHGDTVLVVESKSVFNMDCGAMQIGTISEIANDSLSVRLAKHHEILDEFDNKLIWTEPDIECLGYVGSAFGQKAPTGMEIVNWLVENRYLVKLGGLL